MSKISELESRQSILKQKNNERKAHINAKRSKKADLIMAKRKKEALALNKLGDGKTPLSVYIFSKVANSFSLHSTFKCIGVVQQPAA